MKKIALIACWGPSFSRSARLSLILVAGLLLPISSFAQFTTVSGTVQDSNGIPYANGTISAVLVPGTPGGWRLSGRPYSGRLQNTTLDSTGSFTVQMGDNNVILPAGTQWLFTVNSSPGGILPPLGTGSQSFTATITITGATQSISATLQAAAPKLTTINLSTFTGNLANGQVAFGTTPANTISGSSNFTYNSGTSRVTITGSGSEGLTTTGTVIATNGNPAATTVSGSNITFPGCIGYSTYVCAATQAGADWSVQVNNAFTALGSTVGTVDARAGYTTAQAMSANITIPAGDFLLWPCLAVTRAVGTHLAVNSTTHLGGCASGTDASGNGVKVSQLLSDGSDGSAAIVEATNPVRSVRIEDLYFGAAGAGAIAINLPGLENSFIDRNWTNTDIGIVIGGTGTCACYNEFQGNILFDTTFGIEFLGLNANQNQMYGGAIRAATAILSQGGNNSFYSVDTETCCATATYDLSNANGFGGNLIMSPYIEAAGPIIFESGTSANVVIGSHLGSISDLSGNTTNIVYSLLAPGSGVSAITSFPSLLNGMGFAHGRADKFQDVSNTTYGTNAFNAATTATSSTAIGYFALNAVTSGNNNTGVGSGALNASTSGTENTAVGQQAMWQANGAGLIGNTAVGASSLLNETSFNNVAIGRSALQSQTGGQRNTAVGYYAGQTDTGANANLTGNNNVWVGERSGPATATQLSNAIAIGATATNTASNEAVIGNASVTDVYLGSETAAAKIHAANFVSSVASTTAVTSSNPTINTDQNLIQLSLGAGYLNVLAQPFDISASGIYSSTAAASPALNFEVKLCTVSGCGSGTVVDLFDITTTALSATALTNATWNLTGICVTNATGATGNLVCHGKPGLVLDTGAVLVTPDSVFSDTNTATLANIDLTAALFLQFTVAQSVAGASNSYTQQLAAIR